MLSPAAIKRSATKTVSNPNVTFDPVFAKLREGLPVASCESPLLVTVATPLPGCDPAGCGVEILTTVNCAGLEVDELYVPSPE